MKRGESSMMSMVAGDGMTLADDLDQVCSIQNMPFMNNSVPYQRQFLLSAGGFVCPALPESKRSSWYAVAHTDASDSICPVQRPQKLSKALMS